MIVGWLVKIVVGFVLVGVLLVEAGSPIVTRIQLDGVAHDAADAAALNLLDRRDPEQAEAEARRVAEDEHVDIAAFEITADGHVKVTIEKEARSIILKKWSKTESWYHVKVTATSAKGAS